MNEADVKEAMEAIIKMAYGADRSISQTAIGTYISSGTDKENLEETLNSIRVQVRYLVFDLEATRRENRYLRHILDNRAKSDNDNADPPENK